MNAAVWFGAAVLFLLGVTPASFSTDMEQVGQIGRNGPGFMGIIDQVYWERFLALQIWCAAIALLHQIAEWLYLGRPLQRFTSWLVLGLLTFTLLDGFWLQPQLQRLHQTYYGYRKTSQGYQASNAYSSEQRSLAGKTLQFWQQVGRFATFGLRTGKISLTLNFLVLGCLGLLVWRLANPVDTPRFIPATKFRS